MSKFLHADDNNDNNNDAKAIAICQIFLKKKPSKKGEDADNSKFSFYHYILKKNQKNFKARVVYSLVHNPDFQRS